MVTQHWNLYAMDGSETSPDKLHVLAVFNHNSNQGLRAESVAQWVAGLPNTRRALSSTPAL